MRHGRRPVVALSASAAVLLAAAACSSQPAGDTESPSASASGSPLAPPNWPQTVSVVETGVVRIDAEGCEKDSEGTGFLVGPDLVLTAGHVIEGSTAVRVDTGDVVSDAEILGIAPNADVALLRLGDESTGHVFLPAAAAPVLADEVAALGYPIGLDLTFTQGRVSGLNRTVGTDTFEGQGFIQTDAAINPGNSGGPLIGVSGEVLGVVSAKVDWTDDLDTRPIEGTAFAAPAERAFRLVQRWVADDSPVPMATCDNRDTEVEVQILADHPRAPAIADSLVAHGRSINEGDYASAFDIFTPRMSRKTGGLELWSQSLQTSFWRNVTVRNVSVDDTKKATVLVALRTEQDALDGFDGQTCSDWLIRYGMVLDDGRWRIDKVKGLGPPTPCAPQG